MRQFLGLTAALCLCAAAGLADETWAIQPDQAACFLDNIDNYQDSGTDPVVIILPACPETDRMAALRKMQKNSGTAMPNPTVYVLEDGTERKADEVIVYNRDELACLARLDIPLAAAPVLLPQAPCDQ